MRQLSRVAGPVVSLLSLTTEAVVRLLRVRLASEANVTEEDVRALLAEGQQAGVFAVAEQQLVESIFDLGQTRVWELMTPRPLIAWLDVDDPPEAVRAQVSAALHHFYPVCRGALDEVLGVVSLKDLTADILAGGRLGLATLVRQPVFLPEQLEAFRALEQLKLVGPHVALVLDEHGGVAGLLTPTDLLEAMVGAFASSSALGGEAMSGDGRNGG